MAADERKIDTPINSSAGSSPFLSGGSLEYGLRPRQARSGEFAPKVTLWQQFRALVSCFSTEVCRLVVQCNRQMGVDSSNSVNC